VDRGNDGPVGAASTFTGPLATRRNTPNSLEHGTEARHARRRELARAARFSARQTIPGVELAWKLSPCANEPGPLEKRGRSNAGDYHRQRRRDGFRWLLVELRETEIDVLVQKGLLTSDARNDARAVREALYQYFDSTLN
jgi:hypothetical protein